MAAAALLAGAARAEETVVYTMRPGDHPWNIAQRYLRAPAMAYQLVRRHHIASPERLQPGTRLTLPVAWLRRQPAPLRVLAVEGAVRVRAAGGAEQAAIAGQELRAPLQLVTGAQGSASLGFADGSRVLVLRDSELWVHEASTRVLDQVGSATLELRRGRVESAVIPQASPGRRFEIRMPAAIAAVRGTQFRVQALGQGADAQALAEVLAGAVQVGNPAGQVLAGAAQGSVVQARKPPSAPVALLPPPDLSALPAHTERLPAVLPLEPLAGATGYRVQLADTPAFASLRLDQIEREPAVHLREVPDGRYVLRVRGIDSQGLEGLASEQALEVRARPEPPLLIMPAPGATTTQARPLLRWTLAPDGNRYQLQLLDGQGALVLDTEVGGDSHQPAQDLAPGPYRWRVARLAPDGRRGPFSELQAFERVEPGPLAQLDTGDDAMVLRWLPQQGAVGYQLQLARDGGFDTPLLDQRTDAAQLPLPALEPGTWQVRVRRLGPAGSAGPWSEAQRFEMPAPPAPRWPLLLLLLPLLL